MQLSLPDPLARALLAGLVRVSRADGEVNDAELGKIRQFARQIGLGEIDEEQLLMSDEMTPEHLATAITTAVAGADPYRNAPLPSVAALKQLFLEAAVGVAIIDLDLKPEELSLLRELTRAFGLPPRIGALSLTEDAD